MSAQVDRAFVAKTEIAPTNGDNPACAGRHHGKIHLQHRSRPRVTRACCSARSRPGGRQRASTSRSRVSRGQTDAHRSPSRSDADGS